MQGPRRERRIQPRGTHTDRAHQPHVGRSALVRDALDPEAVEVVALGLERGVLVPVLIVQGESDPFGMPPEGANRKVVRLKGNHSLRSDVTGLREAVREFLRGGDDGDVD